MAIQVSKTSIQLLPEDRDFIDMLKARCDLDGQLPYKLNELTAIRIIKECARFFYKWYINAQVKNVWGLISKDEIKRYLTNNGSEPFRDVASFSVKLPPAVRGVWEVFERGSTSIDPDINASAMTDTIQLLNRQYNSTLSGGYSLLGINNNLYMEEAVCRLFSNNALESITSVMVSYSYSYESRLLIINKNLKEDLIIKYDQNIDLKYLYEDTYFERYCVARCFKEMRRLVGGHTIDLPGGATTNVEEMYPIDDISTIEEYVKSGSTVGDIVIQRQ